MLRGDLAFTPLTDALRQLAAEALTGCLKVRGDGSNVEAKIYVRDGAIYAATAPGPRPMLGVRLVSSNALAPEALDEALEAQATELSGWRLGELLVHLGYVPEAVVHDFVTEQVRDTVTEIAGWPSGAWRFRRNERTREAAHAPVPVDVMLDQVADRQREWDSLLPVFHGPDATPVLFGAGKSSDIDADSWALLCKVDGAR